MVTAKFPIEFVKKKNTIRKRKKMFFDFYCFNYVY